MLEEQCKMFGIPYEPAPPPDHWLEHEENIQISNLEGQCLHTPGHTSGSVSFLFKHEKLLVAGDTLFQGSIGRTDLWGGDFKTIEKSISEKGRQKRRLHPLSARPFWEPKFVRNLKKSMQKSMPEKYRTMMKNDAKLVPKFIPNPST